MSPGKIGLILFALACVALTLLNASLIAPKPPGELILIAHRGITQPEGPSGAPCPARHIAADSGHAYVENTILSMRGAMAYGARGFALDVRRSADGHAIVFRDETLDCRTDGTGRIADRPLAYLKGLDAGFGYSPDGGRTFPLRGRSIGAIPTAAEVLRAFPDKILIFVMAVPADADALAAAFGEAGVTAGDRHGFAGPPEALARIATLAPGGWTVDPAASDACLGAYRRTGWTSFVPAACQGTTLILPRTGEWTLWGWPYRFLARMAGADARTLIAEPGLTGLDDPEQLSEVPRHYHGMLLVDDMVDVGGSLR
jgi:glycerophosphoryl diester phosphodiesterase